ncbi:HNH endonuclease family protein [Candidatus Thiodictyon syntrophicum]|uniref:HNH endonuclease family protein n=1 Tax=Candidatus Thiodictyon syntrophicum TaxID=1166950 RepID=UPI001562759D|nr:HNH endonuclease family protein [Candidatus Thiodictyon syntrophicum]
MDDDDLKKTCREMLYQRENRWQNIPGRTRLVYKIRDNVSNFLEQYVKPDGGSQDQNLASIAVGNNLSLANMAAGMRIIHACFDDVKRFPNADSFDRFAVYLLNNALFIYVATEDLDDAFRLFTILNDRGIPLSNSDILKAKNLGEISSDKECSKWATYWEEVEGELGRDEFDRFLSLVRTIYVKDKAREGLLKEFDERIYGAKPRPLLALGTATFEAVKAYKDAFDTSILFDNLPVSVGNAYRNRINVMRRGLPSTDWVPPVLAWYRKFGVTKLLEFVERVDNKFSADWIMQLTPTQRISNMNEVLKSIDLAQQPDQLFTSQVFDFDATQLMTLLNGDIYGRRFAKYVLLRLEYLLSAHTAQLNLPDDISVEHILPQTPADTSQWVRKFTQSEREIWRHRLGNLMLLSRRKNASLGNLDFAAKKTRYFEDRVESLPNSQRVLILNRFASAELQARHQDLIGRLQLSY